jgi:FAD:protein FMN transferase
MIRRFPEAFLMLQLFSFPFSAMATACTVHMYGDDSIAVEAAAEAAITEVMRIEKRYSRYRADSVLTEINNAAQCAGSITVDDETAGLLDYAYACYLRSNGLFDITSGILRRIWDFKSGRLPDRTAIDDLLPRIGLANISWERPRLTFPKGGMELDFGGIGKEYAADQAAAVCTALGIRHGLIDLGGDIAVIGPHPNLTPWNVGIRHPRDPKSKIVSVLVDKGALASSGDYERYMEIDGHRYCHILDPITGWPSHGLAAVSVIADSCLVAGTISTIAMLKGREGISWLSGLGFNHLFVDEDGVCGGNMLPTAPRTEAFCRDGAQNRAFSDPRETRCAFMPKR